MKYRLEILRPMRVTDRFGSVRTEYEPVNTIHAERVKQTPSYGEQAGELFAGYRTLFNIRDCHEVDENWRVRQAGGHLYTVTNIEYNRDRGMQTLVCTRVNE